MTRMAGRFSDDHVCHLCQGKSARQLWRNLVKRQKRREERHWKRDQDR